MRILIATAGYPPQVGGVEQVTYNLAKEFVRLGHDVAVVAPCVRGEPDFSDAGGVLVRRLPYPMPQQSPRDILEFAFRFPWADRAFDRVVTEFQPDVINSHFAATTNSLYSVRAVERHGLPLVVSLHGADVEKMPEVSTSWRRVALSAIRHADALTACSDHIRLRAGRLDEKALAAKVIRNGIDLSEFDFQAESPEEQPMFLALGRFVRQKGFDVLLYAFRRVVEVSSEPNLVLIGEGPEAQSLRGQTERLGIQDRVTILSSVPRPLVIGTMKTCMAVVVPSRMESLGIVSMEAMAAGKPVVASDVGGIPEVVRHQKNGLLVPPEDPEALAAAMLEIAGDAELRKRLGEEGRRQAASMHTWPTAAAAYLDCYNTAICSKQSSLRVAA